MNFLRLRDLLTEIIQTDERLTQVHPMGNVIYVEAEGVEFELVIKTTKPEYRSKHDLSEDYF